MAFRVFIGIGLIFAATGASLAQTPDLSLTFEVATVKPAALPTATEGKRMFRMGAQGGPGTSDPGQISYSFMPLRALLTQAFGVRNYQVQGPAWLDSERFDIVAKVPAGATKDDVKIMLQNLLKERFQLAFHRENKEQSVYALLVAKNGPKMTVSEDQSDPSTAPAAAAGPPPVQLPDPGRLKVGKDGMPELPPGVRRPGIVMMGMMSPGGMRMKLNGSRQTLAQLADSLSNQVDRPVVDMTGLAQRYDFTLDFAPDPSVMMAKMGPMPGGMPPPPMLAGGGGAGLAGPAGDGGPVIAPPSTDAATLFAAIQDQLGLKLESRKAPADLLVIDHLEKTPSEN
jgi:uncharacterized protein (TIGR03435 family)